MPAIEIRPNVYWIGVDDRTTDLFEGLWPITDEGVSYNSYLIDDDKKVIIDLTKSLKVDDLLAQIDQVTDVSSIDYIVVNHMEPDHSGVLRLFRRVAPNVVLLGSQKTKDMLATFYGITDNVRVVEDGETISLGSKSLQFFSAPFVHWPETIVTYEASDQILFSCDAFGGYQALGGAIFDDQHADLEFYQRESLRYYVNIVARFSRAVLRAIEKLSHLPIKIIAPSHGLIWREHPDTIVALYKKWAGYALSEAEVGVSLIYGSMYGNTEKMMSAVAQGISGTGVPLEIFDAGRIHVSHILPALWTQRGVMVGAPTYEGTLFPPMANVLTMAAQKNIRNRHVARFGSYGWSGGAQRHFETLIEPMKWTLSESMEFVGSPTRQELAEGEAFGRRFGHAVKG